MVKVIRWACRSTERLIVVAAALVVVAGLLLVWMVTPKGDAPADPTLAPVAVESRTSVPRGTPESDPVKECIRVTDRFAASFFSAGLSDEQWQAQVSAWVTEEVAQDLGTIDRREIPPVTPVRSRVERTWKDSCQSTVIVGDGDTLPVLVERVTGEWRVSSWG